MATENRNPMVMNTPHGANKYEMAIVAAREARRLNNHLRQSGETETSSAKVTMLALTHSLRGEVAFTYEDAAAPATPPPPPEE